MKKPNDVFMILLTLPSLMGVLSMTAIWAVANWPRLQNPWPPSWFQEMRFLYLPPFELITGAIGAFYFSATSKSWLMILCGILDVVGILVGGFTCFVLFLIMTQGLPVPG